MMEGPITPEMTIGEIVKRHPMAAGIMMAYGLHCIGCHVSQFESLGEGAMAHGLAEDDLKDMLHDLNEAISKADSLPNTITITEAAAKKVKELLTEDKAGFHLRVQALPGGCAGFNYSLSFDDQQYADDIIFQQEGFKLMIDPESMGLMKGSSIDYVEGPEGTGFKVDNPNASPCGCGKSFEGNHYKR